MGASFRGRSGDGQGVTFFAWGAGNGAILTAHGSKQDAEVVRIGAL